MQIQFYTPFKPLGHPHPSGDLIIAEGLFRFLSEKGHQVHPIRHPRTRWIYWQPYRWPSLLAACQKHLRRTRRCRAHLWLTYHAYYKAPDIIGPFIARQCNIPYVIFQGIYSTKRRRRLKTWPGFVLNRRALLQADHVFTNRMEDLVNLRRLLPEERLSYIRPGMDLAPFQFDAEDRNQLRAEWGVGDTPVILSAAMFRPDVKTEGLKWVIRSCGRLALKGVSFQLVIAGDGKEKKRLMALADRHLKGTVRFVGKVAREEMHRFYSAGDLFVFPGIRESLGMVYLESQSCGLPVVAFDNGGIPEVVEKGKTGFLTPPFKEKEFDRAVESLLSDADLRYTLGQKAAKYVRTHHDIHQNYRKVTDTLHNIVGGHTYE